MYFYTSHQGLIALQTVIADQRTAHIRSDVRTTQSPNSQISLGEPEAPGDYRGILDEPKRL